MIALRKINGFLKAAQLLLETKSTIALSSLLRRDTDVESIYNEILESDSEYQDFADSHLKLDPSQNCYIIQPYVKWGRQKLHDITPAEQLDEAKALISTLPSWRVEDTATIPLETLDKNTLFRSGNLDKLKQIIRKNASINAVFINLGTLKKAQMLSLEKEFGTPILDRYKVVMQILKVHATSKHAKLQVALAELYYLRRTTIHEMNFGKVEREKIKLMFQSREQKLKTAVKALRVQRCLLRNNRQKNEYPIVAVVGYTNSGKTSIIKALTGEEGLKPRNQLFATLDVTMHAGLLPSGLKILYVDTVGFISDIPTNLIECFVATLEDAVLADVILHVEDISSSVFEFKRKHVTFTLQDLGAKAGADNILEKVFSIGNKCDLVPAEQDYGLLKVSAKTEIGLDILRINLEGIILETTNRKKINIKVPNGGDEIRWLYKNSTVVSETVDETSSQFIVANVIITSSKLQQFKHYYAQR